MPLTTTASTTTRSCCRGDRRNVVDRTGTGRARRSSPTSISGTSFHVAIENWQHDLNIGAVVRTANAFLAAEVHIVGGAGGTAAAPW